VHLRRGEELVAEVIRELGIDHPVHHPAEAFGLDLEIILLDGHPQRLRAELAGVLLGVALAIVRQSARDDEHGLLKLWNPQVLGTELDHAAPLIPK